MTGRKSRHQDSVALSTSEAEYMAVSGGDKEVCESAPFTNFAIKQFTECGTITGSHKCQSDRGFKS